MDPLWDQFAALIPEHVDNRRLGCHQPPIPDRLMSDCAAFLLLGLGITTLWFRRELNSGDRLTSGSGH